MPVWKVSYRISFSVFIHSSSLAQTISPAILNLTFWYLQNVCLYCISPTLFPDDLVAEKEKNKVLQEEMEATLHDIQNM